MTNVVWIVAVILAAVLGYFLGAYRAIVSSELDYDKGYKEGFEAGVDFVSNEDNWRASKDDYVGDIARQLDELFDDEEDEGFTYGSMYFPPKKEFNEIHRTLDNNGVDCGEY